MYKNPNKFIQFELWKDCTIGCKFCCNKGQPKINKLESLAFILDTIDTLDKNEYNEIGFIGGEFFNGELEDKEVKEKFYDLFKKVNCFEKVYLATSLIFDGTICLWSFLDYLRNLKLTNKLVLCTSFDVKYRFHTQEKKELWKKNVLHLKEKYPEIKLHTEIILTEWFLQAVLSNNFKLTDFSEVFNTSIDYIEPSSGLFFKDKHECEKQLPGFFPKKGTFIEFIKKCIHDNLIDKETFLSMELRSNILYFLENGNRRKVENRRQSDGRCEISDKTKKYDIGFIDSELSMKQVAEEIFKIYNVGN